MNLRDKKEWLYKHGVVQYGAPSPTTGRTYCYWTTRNHAVTMTKYGSSAEGVTCNVFDEAKETLFERCNYGPPG